MSDLDSVARRVMNVRQQCLMRQLHSVYFNELVSFTSWNHLAVGVVCLIGDVVSSLSVKIDIITGQMYNVKSNSHAVNSLLL